MASTLKTFSEAEKTFEARNWQKARDDFQNNRGHKDQKKMSEFLAQYPTAQQAKLTCDEAQAKAKKEYRSAVGGILSKIEIFMKVGDLAIKSAPESVGLAWAGVRFCLHTIEDDFATFKLFSGAAADIIGILISCRVYGRMWGGSKGLQEFQEMHSKVIECIPDIYTDILDFSYNMMKQMDRNKAVRFVRGALISASSIFQPLIDRIKSSDKKMAGYAKTATDQLTTFYQEQGLQNQDAMRADLSLIQETLDESVTTNRVFLEQFRQMQEEMKDMRKKTPFDKAKENFDYNTRILKPTDAAEIALKKNLRRRGKDTCNWILELEKYKAWRSSVQGSFLWVSGVSGLGKSILMATVISGLQEEFEGSKDAIVEYFFCSAGDDSTRTAARIKQQLLHQLYERCQSEGVPDVLERANIIMNTFLGQKDSSDGKSSSQQKKSIGFDEAYQSLARSLEKNVFFVIDALDECTDRKSSEILQTLRATVGDSVRILLCSRPELGDDLENIPRIMVEEHNGPDIERAARTKLEDIPGLDAADRSLACNAIVEKAKGLFRCVDPAIEFLKKPWRRPLQNRLADLPDGLDNSYLQSLSQTDPDYLELLEVGLTWTIFGSRDPTLAEIMDDYSRTYEEGFEGDDENPYDIMTGHSLQQTRDQIRKAGSNTFLEVMDRSVSIRHPTVKQFFLKPQQIADNPHGHSPDELCPICKAKVVTDQPLSLSEKEGHLRMALTIFKHLNAPLFQRRYLLSHEAMEIVRRTKEMFTRETQSPTMEVENESAIDNSIQQVPETQSSGSSSAQPMVPNGATSELSFSNGANAYDPDDSIPRLKSFSEDPMVQGGEGIERSVPTGDVSPPVESMEQQPDFDSEDDNEEEENVRWEHFDVPTSDVSPPVEIVEHKLDTDSEYDNEEEEKLLWEQSTSNGEQEGEEKSVKRYELTHWPHHLQMAEKLWTPAERDHDSRWGQLWDLVIEFLYSEPKVFNAWLQDYTGFHEDLDINSSHRLNPLQTAAALGLVGLTKVLLDRGEPVGARLPDGRDALWFGAMHGVGLVQLLLAHSGNPNSGEEFPTPFYQLLWARSDIESVRLMLDHGADCTMKDCWGYYALNWFVSRGSDVQILEALLDAGADINAIDKWGETPLRRLMSSEPPLELLNAFLGKGAIVNAEDHESQMPLYGACMAGNAAAVKILLDHQADIHDTDVDQRTALHAAALYGHLEVVKLLIKAGATLGAKDKEGRTPFYDACSYGELETARHLSSCMRDQGVGVVNQPLKNGRTPFSKAAGRGYIETVQFLLQWPDVASTVNAVETEKKRTALHWAAYGGKIDVVEFLLQFGADATIRDSDGNTALTICGQAWARGKITERETIIVILIDHDWETAKNDTNLMSTAAIKGSTQVIEKLLDAQAHPGQQDEHGWTPLQLARQHGHIEAANLLARRGAEVGSRPSRFVSEDPHISVSDDGCELEYKSKFIPKKDRYVSVLTDHPIPAGVERFYFECYIKDSVGYNLLFVAIGLTNQPLRLDVLPGYWSNLAPSFAWAHCALVTNTVRRTQLPRTSYGKNVMHQQGDTIGCGVIYDGGIEGKIFFTKNGVPQGLAFEENVKGRLYPVLGFEEDSAVVVNLGHDVEKKPFVWELANSGRYDIESVKANGDLEGEKTPSFKEDS